MQMILGTYHISVRWNFFQGESRSTKVGLIRGAELPMPKFLNSMKKLQYQVISNFLIILVKIFRSFLKMLSNFSRKFGQHFEV